ncbi:YfgM family protein [Chitinilyticum litopenaei]|uniref:YfgM family protein n=1 Tax=Chitinilyticum litopenaei TaxID=1121276 RepID=UPI00041BDA75|nr:tetratricopeptide repeat protein [Chitinilyticum litopenaei]
MAAFDLQEQEQIAAFKAWWVDWGRYVAAALLVAVLGFAAWQGWLAWQRHVNAKASAVFLQLQQSADEKQFQAQLQVLKLEYPSSAYATRAALLAAQQGYVRGKLPEARSELQWVLANTSEVTVRDITRLRLAAIALDEKKYDEALGLVKAPEAESYAGIYADFRGDVLQLKGDKSAAREAYKSALARTDKELPGYKLIEFKLDALGAK